MAKTSLIQALQDIEYSAFPAIAVALDDIRRATNAVALRAARDALRRAELERDIALGFTDMWTQWEREHAFALGLIKAGGE